MEPNQQKAFNFFFQTDLTRMAQVCRRASRSSHNTTLAVGAGLAPALLAQFTQHHTRRRGRACPRPSRAVHTTPPKITPLLELPTKLWITLKRLYSYWACIPTLKKTKYPQNLLRVKSHSTFVPQKYFFTAPTRKGKLPFRGRGYFFL